MPRQQQVSQQQKKPRSRTPQVLDAAVSTFAVKGYENTSMQEIGESLGLLKGSIYYYVDSKEDLLYSIIKAVHLEMMANLERAGGRDGDVEPRLQAFLEDMIELTVDRREHATVFQREFRHLSDEHRKEINKERRQYEAFLEAMLEEGQAQGVVRTDIDARLLTVASMTMISAISTWYRRGGKLGKKEIVRDYTGLLMSAVKPAHS
jgi:TetR/AcrR family transcriptional regulator, cholesterol catabolism regulator